MLTTASRRGSGARNSERGLDTKRGRLSQCRMRLHGGRWFATIEHDAGVILIRQIEGRR